MEIQLETAESHTIRSYTDHCIVIGERTFTDSCIISSQSIQSTWPSHSIVALSTVHLPELLIDKPDVIIIGHAGKPILLAKIASELSQHKIGIECMPIGAACRTFNVLLSEHRAVVLGMIFASTQHPLRTVS